MQPKPTQVCSTPKEPKERAVRSSRPRFADVGTLVVRSPQYGSSQTRSRVRNSYQSAAVGAVRIDQLRATEPGRVFTTNELAAEDGQS